MASADDVGEPHRGAVWGKGVQPVAQFCAPAPKLVAGLPGEPRIAEYPSAQKPANGLADSWGAIRPRRPERSERARRMSRSPRVPELMARPATTVSLLARSQSGAPLGFRTRRAFSPSSDRLGVQPS